MIAPTASSCPKFGAPNTWVHPEIQRFQRAVSSFTRTPPFEHEGKGFVLTGTAKVPEQPNSLADTGRFLFAAGILVMLSNVFLPIVPIQLSSIVSFGGIICLALAGKTDFKPTNETKRFQIDFSGTPPRWTSDDDTFWQEVRDFFLPPP